jgi:hypothetical protein
MKFKWIWKQNSNKIENEIKMKLKIKFKQNSNIIENKIIENKT